MMVEDKVRWTKVKAACPKHSAATCYPRFFCYHIASSCTLSIYHHLRAKWHPLAPSTPPPSKGLASAYVFYSLCTRSVYARLTVKSQIRAVAALNGLKVDLPEHYVHFEDNKKPEFLAKFPHGKIPAFDGADGFKLFESAAIARYSESIESGRERRTDGVKRREYYNQLSLS